MRKLCICVLVLLMLVLTVSAQTSFVQDDSNLLSKEQKDALNTQMQTYQKEFDLSIGFVSAEHLDGKSIEGFTQSYYNQSGYGNDCALLVICENEGQWYIYTNGLCATQITDADIEQIGAAMMDDLQTGCYYEAVQTFVQRVAEPVCQTISNLDAEAQQLQNSRNAKVVFGLVGGLIVGIAVAVMLGITAKRQRLMPALKHEANHVDV